MKYFVGDIVEVITHERDKPFQSHYPELFRGQRFRIHKVIKDSYDRDKTGSYLYGYNSLHLSTKEVNVMLYKRPFRNWVKYFYHTITKKEKYI